MKKIDLTWPEISIPIWPIMIAGEQRPRHGAEAEAAELARPDPVAHRQRHEDRELRIGAERVHNVAQHVMILL